MELPGISFYRVMYTHGLHSSSVPFWDYLIGF